jgi:hypothetical protein
MMLMTRLACGYRPGRFASIEARDRATFINRRAAIHRAAQAFVAAETSCRRRAAGTGARP